MIDWTHASLEEAERESCASGRPLLLLWTAEWCPPCHELRSRVLADPGFAARAAPYLRVRVESEAPGAQAAAERYGLHGYPTLVIRRSGSEVVRCPPSGVPTQRYIALLDDARASPLTLEQRIDRLRAGELEPREHRLLAWHYWAGDRDWRARHPGFEVLGTALRTVGGAGDVVGRALAARVILEAVTHGTGSAGHRQLLEQLLADSAVEYADLYEILVNVQAVVDALGHDVPDRQQLARDLDLTSARMETEQSLTLTDRLILGHARLALGGRTEHEERRLRARLTELASGADAALTDASERQTALNMAAHVLWALGEDRDCERTYLGAIESSAAPSYFMQPFSRFLHERGRSTEAREWLARAWLAASGPAERLMIGAKWVALLVSQGAASTEIGTVARRIVTEVRKAGTPICGRLREPWESLQVSVRLGAPAELPLFRADTTPMV